VSRSETDWTNLQTSASVRLTDKRVRPPPPERFSRKAEQHQIGRDVPVRQEAQSEPPPGAVERAPAVHENPIPLSEAAERYALSLRTLRGWIHRGTLPAAKPGREYLVRAADLEQLLTPSTRERRTG
jgi:excisionase family DNA binding protein